MTAAKAGLCLKSFLLQLTRIVLKSLFGYPPQEAGPTNAQERSGLPMNIPPNGAESCSSAPPITATVIRRDSVETRLEESAASFTNDGEGNTNELHSAPARRARARRARARIRRNSSSPYWYNHMPVYELVDYTDGTPLQAGHVWVETESGDAFIVKEADLVKKLPPRRSKRSPHRRRRLQLQHNLFSVPPSRRGKKKNEKRDNETNRSPSTAIRTLFGSYNGNGATETELECPVGYRFTHIVQPSCHHSGYECEAEVVAVEGECEYIVWLTRSFLFLSVLTF